MPLNPRTYQENYNIIKARIQSNFPKSDFTEGSFLDVLTGSFCLGYQELQSLIIQSFSRTFFTNPATTGDHLNTLALDHFNLSRPASTKARGTLKITRKAGNTNAVTVPKNKIFTTGADPELEYKVISSDATIAASAAADTSVNVNIEALLADTEDVSYNLVAGQEWSVDGIENITITNEEEVIGGRGPMNDEDFREYISDFVQSITDGTVTGLEGAARTIPGVYDAKVVKNLVSVGTLTSTGALEASPKRFNAIELVLYVAGERSAVNSAVLERAKDIVNMQLSAGEAIKVVASEVRRINITAQIAFGTTQSAIQLAEDKAQIIEAVEDYINGLPIGTGLNLATMESTTDVNGIIKRNNWDNLVTSFNVTDPPGNMVNTTATRKLVAGTVTLS